MTKLELILRIQNGENSETEFKRDEVDTEGLAKELVAFLNFEGGAVLLGVDDSGEVVGTTRDRLEEWVANICRTKIEPPIIPFLEWVRDVEDSKNVLMVRVPTGRDKPYARIHNGRRVYFIRVGSTSREASREELQRLFQSSGRILYGLTPVSGSSIRDFDMRRLFDYFARVLHGTVPDAADLDGWQRLLQNVDLMVSAGEDVAATVDGLLLFAPRPKRSVPQAGIRAIAYSGTEQEYEVLEDVELNAPLVALGDSDGQTLEQGLMELALEFVSRHSRDSTEFLDDVRRNERVTYPLFVLREIVVNALVHRDYSITGTDVTLSIFSDRLEVQSPGGLPNTVSVEGMRAGFRYARNQTLVNVMRDYGYVEARGMGIRTKVIPGMRDHNRTEPEFIAERDRFTIRLRRDPEIG